MAPKWPYVPPAALLQHWDDSGREVVTDYLLARQQHRDGETFSPNRLHELLAVIPAGNWASYGDVATVSGTGAQALGSHLRSCADCPHPHRVLQDGGAVAAGFRPAGSSADFAEQLALLAAEGVPVEDGRADPSRRLGLRQLRDLGA